MRLDPPTAIHPGRTIGPTGDVRTAISDGLVALLKEYYGRGPDKTKTYVTEDLVVCLLRGGFTRVEQTLRDGGHGGDVIRQRMAFQEVMRERFEQVVEEATGRTVIGFMSGNQQDPDMICEVFVLARTTSSTERRTGRGPRAALCPGSDGAQALLSSRSVAWSTPARFLCLRS